MVAFETCWPPLTRSVSRGASEVAANGQNDAMTPIQTGTFLTCRHVRLGFVMRTKADSANHSKFMMGWTPPDGIDLQELLRSLDDHQFLGWCPRRREGKYPAD